MIPNLFGNVISKLTNAILTFIAIVILSRLLGAEGNGYFSLFATNTALAILVIGLGIENAFTFFVAQKSFDVQKIFNSSILFSILQAFACILIAYLLQLYFSVNLFKYTSQNFISISWLAIFIYFFANFLMLYLSALFNGEQLFTHVNKAVRYIQLSTIIVLLFFGTYIKQNFGQEFGLINCFIILQCIAPAFLIFKYITVVQPSHRFHEFLNFYDFKNIMRFGGLALLINGIQFLANRADLWILDFYNFTKADIGIYGLSQRLIQMYWMVPIAIAGITYPMLSRVGSLSTSLLTKAIKIIVQVWFYLSVITLFVAPFFTTLFFGKAFKESVNPFLIILPGALLFLFAIMLAPYFSAKNLLLKNLIVSGICLLIILALDFILIPKYGITGAALASSIGYGAAGVMSLWLYCKIENIAIRSFFTRSKNIVSDINTTFLGK